ncbi:MAG: Translation initiation factor IF-2 [candidate division TM6 bacterium GW2011_GWE2_41_16]|nr:MAG: Translation initiation factor IF-2 [candidate division TM6 bacterium GW2011_GWE2_41_16]
MRVYEYSKKYGMKSKDVLEILEQKDFDISSHMAVLPQEAIDMLDQYLEKSTKKTTDSILKEKITKQVELGAPKSEQPVPASQKEPSVAVKPVFEKNVPKLPVTQPKQETTQPAEKKVIEQKKVPQTVSAPFVQKVFTPIVAKQGIDPVKKTAATPLEPKNIELKKEAMTVGLLADVLGKNASEIIVTLLRKGHMATKNQLLSIETIATLAEPFGFTVAKDEPKSSQNTDITSAAKLASKGEVAGATQTKRKPIVVVVGHVDHGKTTLLDYIRKTRVASREKGGITQHLGAYEAQTKHGSIVFIDTPGHEAFTMMRVRGIRAADIIVLIVAADDGIMPQTIEAIKAAQRSELPIIVAINKVDKVSPAQIEQVYKGLAQHGLLSEAWGGQTVCVSISAKTGQNVDELLEMIDLQAEMLELKADLERPAIGFVLESMIEHGRGPVATIICQHGMLRVGDNFACGTMFGRVSSLFDSFGHNVREIGPADPVRVAGFSQLPSVGDVFKVGSQKEVQEWADLAKREATAPRLINQALTGSKESLPVLLKTDNLSSQEALINSMDKISGKTFKHISVVRAGVGPLNEGDIEFAADTGALVYGLHVKIEPSATVAAQRLGVEVHLFDIIYKFLEDIALVADKNKPIKMISKKIAEALVLKVFDIKNVGVIAGCRVVSGVLPKDSKLVVWRGKHKIGEGKVSSLQRDKKSVKEVHKGFECGFMIDGYTDWQVDDRVEAFIMVPQEQQ